MAVLVVVDTTRIQSYIFASNRLRENVGASYLVTCATEMWPSQIVEDLGGDTGNAKVLYSGGGNFLAVFSKPDDFDNKENQELARQFTRNLSRKILTQAPGLPLRCVHEDVSPGDKLSDKIDVAFRHLQSLSYEDWISTPLMGLSVTRPCASSGLPAVDEVVVVEGDERYFASADVYAKARQEVFAKASDAFSALLELPRDYRYPRDFDQLGRSEGEHSYIAVVHADGNKMGAIIQEIKKRSGENNEDFSDTISKFSKHLRDATENSVKVVQSQLINWLNVTSSDELSQIEDLRNYYRQQQLLPFRPLIVGGDDVTFVADGRIGISLAVKYLEAFEKFTSADQRLMEIVERDKLTACAGVAIVKTHYPFARAYDLAEALTKSAKAYCYSFDEDMSGLDWHYSTTGLFGDLDQIREREGLAVWSGNRHSLYLRPVTIGDNPLLPQSSWTNIRDHVLNFQYGPWSNNKLKMLFQTLRNGPDAVQRFCDIYEQDLENTEGWFATPHDSEAWYCDYHDPLELYDWFIDLDRITS